MFLVTYIKKHNNTYTALKSSLAKPLYAIEQYFRLRHKL